MSRCGWHWVSFDILFATIGLGLINFTDHFDNTLVAISETQTKAEQNDNRACKNSEQK
jgi:hypothetical protein